MQITAALQAKGARGLGERVGSIGRRFGVSARPMEQRLSRFTTIAASSGAVPTFAVTAVVLGRHASAVRELAERGAELAVHGLVHNDHTAMSPDQQAAGVRAAAALFQRHGVSTAGFRAPYLRADDGTVRAVELAGLEYDSSRAAAFDVLPSDIAPAAADRYRRVLQYYDALDARRNAVRPSLVGQVVRVPVSLPDDESMVDRLHLGPEQQCGVWCDLLAATIDRGELFTVQLHPERFDECEQALVAVLGMAASRSGRVWVASLREVAQWWRSRATAAPSCSRGTDGTVTVRLEGAAGAWLEVVGQGAPLTGSSPRSIVLPAERPDPAVGVGPGVSAWVARFLQEEGFLVRQGADAVGSAVVVRQDPLDELSLLAQLVSSPHPMVRVARWPHGHRSALTVTGDVDSITLGDFVRRGLETRQATRSRPAPLRQDALRTGARS